MGLVIASYPDPRDPTTPLANAYAYVHRLQVNFTENNYFMEVWIQKSAALAALVPPPDKVAGFTLQPGSILVPEVPAHDNAAAVPAVVAPTLDQFWANVAANRAANPALADKDCLKKTIYDLVKQYQPITPNTES